MCQVPRNTNIGFRWLTGRLVQRISGINDFGAIS